MVAFANADIYLDDSWRLLWSTDLETPKFLALLRWDVDTEGKATLFGPRADSQDTWVVSSNAVKAVEWDWQALNFPFGKGGCDNAITVEMFRKRFLVANPALSLKTYHLHTSAIRNYDPRDIVDKPAYLYIQPTGLHDMRAVTDLSTAGIRKNVPLTAFARPVRGPLSESQARTFCAMIHRSTQGAVNLECDSQNMWQSPPLSFYDMKNVFQTREGLVYTYDSILVGKSKASTTAWSKSQLSSLSASLSVEDAIIAPLPDEVAANPSRYVLSYMAKIFLLQDTFGKKGEFWCANNPAMVEALKLFTWDRELPVVSRNETHQTWCSNAFMWPYQDDSIYVTREEVGALRKAFRWNSEVEKRLVIVVDPKWMTQEAAEAMEKRLGMEVTFVWGTTSLETSVQAMRNAWGVVLFNCELASWCWVLPKGAYVWEIQSEMEANATILHLACAAELEHRLTIVPKGGGNDVEREAMVAKIVTAILGDQPSKEVGRPQILMPRGLTGFYGHSGDSFREMVRIWAKRGYVDCVEASVVQIWLGGVGKTLLYDRPTYEWLENAPAAEKVWERALFGNPPPTRGVSWSFWPRRPVLVEDAVERGLPKKAWEIRSKTIVFYGRSENSVQRSRRTGVDWGSVCDEFVHVDGLNKYVFTQEEYLERLADARYGLCLAGYGNKCHREIECMAMGCVPVVAPEVDMDHYADPPVEGLHYFRVKGPEDVVAVKKETAERWTVMSAACRQWWLKNASAEGMWELTARLSSSPPSSRPVLPFS
jgi:hypothetical protein